MNERSESFLSFICDDPGDDIMAKSMGIRLDTGKEEKEGRQGQVGFRIIVHLLAREQVKYGQYRSL